MDPNRRRPFGQEEPSISPSSGTLRAARRTSSSGQYPLHYTRVREILLRYLSPILVDSVLDRALGMRHLTPAMLSPAALGELTGDIMIGLRLFVPENDLPQLMLELAEVLEMVNP
ncbi:MAG TPA: hypothetical protein VGI10_03930 [Polyangiaceae bacterium]|jgi:hypothetical protein